MNDELKDYSPHCENLYVDLMEEASGANNDAGGDGKQSNPKDALGSDKLPLDLIPFPALAQQALAHMDGALKYGRWNWRIAGVRASIYVAAAMRHIIRYNEGEDYDPDSGLSNLAHAQACLNILIDATAQGMLMDDRPPPTENVTEFQEMYNDRVKMLKKQHQHRKPKHYSKEDVCPAQGKLF